MLYCYAIKNIEILVALMWYNALFKHFLECTSNKMYILTVLSLFVDFILPCFLYEFGQAFLGELQHKNYYTNFIKKRTMYFIPIPTFYSYCPIICVFCLCVHVYSCRCCSYSFSALMNQSVITFLNYKGNIK